MVETAEERCCTLVLNHSVLKKISSFSITSPLLAAMLFLALGCRPAIVNQSGAARGLSISPSTKSVTTGNSVAFSASGGKSPYRFEVLEGSGTIGIRSGVYTAGTSGTDVIRVTDSAQSTKEAVITVYDALTVTSDTSISQLAGETRTFTVNGGVPPLAVAFSDGTGQVSLSGSTVSFKAGAAISFNTIVITDGNSNTATVYAMSLGSPEVWITPQDPENDGYGSGVANGGNYPTGTQKGSRGARLDTPTGAGFLPTYTESSANYNNKPVVTFAGGDCMPFADEFMDDAEFSFFGVYHAIVTGGRKLIIGNSDLAGTGYVQLGGVNNVRAIVAMDSSANSIAATLGNSFNIPSVHIGIGDLTNQTMYAYENTTDSSANTPAFDVNYKADTGDMPVFGAISTDCATYKFNGEVADIVYYDTILTAAEIQELRCYAANRYGLTTAGSCN